MGLISFLIFAVIVLCIAAFFVWVLGRLAPGHPSILDNVIWVLAVVIVLLQLWQAVGGHDVPIPRVFGR